MAMRLLVDARAGLGRLLRSVLVRPSVSRTVLLQSVFSLFPTEGVELVEAGFVGLG
jgi:hypothetical protein